MFEHLGRRSRAKPWGLTALALGRWFESHLRHECLLVPFNFVMSCEGNARTNAKVFCAQGEPSAKTDTRV